MINGKEIHISINKNPTRINILILFGHFREPRPPLDKIYVKGLFTEEIENQVDLTPAKDFSTRRRYYIEVLDYKGILSVSRAKVSVYFGNLGGPDPTPTPPDPIPNTPYYIFGGIFTGIICIIIISLIYLKKRRERND